eukprot:COSAG06_NODE_28783_length_568_cov_1.098081_2_plen_136_part_01
MDLGNQPVAATLKIQQTHISLRNYTEPFSREDHFPSAHHRPGDKHNRTKLQGLVKLRSNSRRTWRLWLCVWISWRTSLKCIDLNITYIETILPPSVNFPASSYPLAFSYFSRCKISIKTIRVNSKHYHSAAVRRKL